MFRKPCRLQTDGRTDGQTGGQGESSIPLYNFVGRGITTYFRKLMFSKIQNWQVGLTILEEGFSQKFFFLSVVIDSL